MIPSSSASRTPAPLMNFRGAFFSHLIPTDFEPDSNLAMLSWDWKGLRGALDDTGAWRPVTDA